jgi:hypothetical protein
MNEEEEINFIFIARQRVDLLRPIRIAMPRITYSMPDKMTDVITMA